MEAALSRLESLLDRLESLLPLTEMAAQGSKLVETDPKAQEAADRYIRQRQHDLGIPEGSEDGFEGGVAL
jgi:hypothetical protein